MTSTDNSPSLLTNQWFATLQQQGYRMTAPLRSLVNILANSSRALGPGELVELGRKSVPGMGLVTVYRALEKLEELGLVQRVHQIHNCHMYLRTPQGHQHLLLCMSCGKVEFFSGDNLNDLIGKISQQSGFLIQDHWLQLYGLCTDCQILQNKPD